MPTYQYTCTDCGEPLEAVQSFSDPSLTVCPSCGGTLRKVFSAVGVVFKGSGFYRTDSRSGSGKGDAAAKSDSGAKPDSAGKNESDGKSETGGKSDSGAATTKKSSDGASSGQSGSSSSSSSSSTSAAAAP